MELNKNASGVKCAEPVSNKVCNAVDLDEWVRELVRGDTSEAYHEMASALAYECPTDNPQKVDHMGNCVEVLNAVKVILPMVTDIVTKEELLRIRENFFSSALIHAEAYAPEAVHLMRLIVSTMH